MGLSGIIFGAGMCNCGLGEGNGNVDQQVQFCHYEETTVVNTCYKLYRTLYSWKLPMDWNGKMERNKIVFIVLRQRFRNSVRAAKTSPATDIGLSHNSVVTRLWLELKKIGPKMDQRI